MIAWETHSTCLTFSTVCLSLGHVEEKHVRTNTALTVTLCS